MERSCTQQEKRRARLAKTEKESLEPMRTMPKVFLLVGSALLAISIPAGRTHAQDQQISRQPGAVYDFDKKGEKPAPAPKHDISGVWEPAANPSAGIQANGAGEMPSDGKPEHELPFTPLGRQTFMAHKPTFGVTQVPSALTNDPMPGCNPQGFPRVVLHNFRTSRILQTPENVVILYEFNKKWRVIWTDGRQLPKDPENPGWALPNTDPAESRWWGYSVGKWMDDSTLVAESNGFDDRTWLDNAGRPHSDALHVIEQYRRADREHLDMTITVDDPKMYTKPWVAVKLRLRLQSPHFDIRELECAPIETEEYNREFGDAASGVDEKK
jgi:hypothetical protein